MTELASGALRDSAAREEALDTSRSILVQAPAGSGKTELLAMRFLKLLAKEEPDRILAITFTNAAAAEMRHRILTKLERAKSASESGVLVEEQERASLQIAREALENCERRGWPLLERPQSLNIQTIDALCQRIARQMPLSSRPGGMLRPTEFAEPLYWRAARETFDRLGGDDAELNSALRALLLLRDSNLANCERLLAEMLATRDQWMRAFQLGDEVNWEEARTRLERPFQRESDRVLGEIHAWFSARPELTRELLDLANYACEAPGLDIDIRALRGLASLPGPDAREHWTCVANLLLRKTDDKWLVSAGEQHGFPKGDSQSGRPFEARQKARRKKLIEELQQAPRLLDMLCDVRRLPPARYTDPQWENLRHICIALRRAVRELENVFIDQKAVDFVELGMAALKVLNGTVSNEGQIKAIRHLLVDEFQDTSRSQHDLIALMLREWTAKSEAAIGRTFFLVGDPMQSIYMFRQADVELFNVVQKRGIEYGAERLPVKTLQLTTNFRSHAGLVNPLNEIFAAIFPHGVKPGSTAIDFLPGTAWNEAEPPGAVEIHPSFLDLSSQGKGNRLSVDAEAEVRDRLRQDETEKIVRIVRRHLPRIEQASSTGEEFTVAVLARAKEHLGLLAQTLRQREIPFRAVELEKLGERQEILDLQSLTRTLLHPMDRIAWLALLRAPWCGLSLRDLHLLCATDEHAHSAMPISLQIAERLPLLNPDSQERVQRCLVVLNAALRHRYKQPSLSLWIERAWHSLGGAACVDATGHENARAYFQLLETMTLDGVAATGESMDSRLDRLFASSDPGVGDRCGVQLMTMHKAKGLGFHVVILPALHRSVKSNSLDLIRYLERITNDGSELLAAPIDDNSGDTSPLYRWVGKQQESREAEERKRLLYVACTRAREELHLFATVKVANSSIKPGASASLLQTAWPALKKIFETEYTKRSARHPATPLPPATGGIIPFPIPAGEPAAGIVVSIAAEKAPRTLRRLPFDWELQREDEKVTVSETIAMPPVNVGVSAPQTMRPRGSSLSRILGTIVHALFERAAKTLEQGAEIAMLQFESHARTLARNQGLPATEIEDCARQATAILKSALADPYGRWILGARQDAQAESSWTGLLGGEAHTVRIDRSFHAGPAPLSEGSGYLWIIDYKTASHSGSGLAAFLEAERVLYKSQLAQYGEMSRMAFGPEHKLRFGLYYPLMKTLDWWE